MSRRSNYRLDYEAWSENIPIKHLAFLSHHKGHGGDAARIFVDTARRMVYERQTETNTIDRPLHSLSDDPSTTPEVSAVPMPRANAPAKGATKKSLFPSTSKKQPPPQLGSAGGTSQLGFAGSLGKSNGQSATPPKDTETAFQQALPKLAANVPTTDLIFLDSNQLYNFDRLLKSVEESSTYLVLLTREVFERPFVLAELCVAHAMGKRIIPINVCWPDDAKNGRDFRFPVDLDSALNDWQMYDESLTKHEKGQTLNRSTRGKDRVERVWGSAANTATLQMTLERARIHVWGWLRERCGYAPPAQASNETTGRVARAKAVCFRPSNSIRDSHSEMMV